MLFEQRIAKSVSRYVMVGVTASLSTWLLANGVDPDDVKEIAELLTALAPAIVAIFWSFKKNKAEADEVKSLLDAKERKLNE